MDEAQKAQLAELVDFQTKLKIFMNMDYIAMTTSAESLDEFLRKKMGETQATAIAKASDNSVKIVRDYVDPI